MDDASLQKHEYRLDWKRVEEIVSDNFEAPEQKLLALHLGLFGEKRCRISKIAKLIKKRPPKVEEDLQKLMQKLYKYLKSEDLQELLQKHRKTDHSAGAVVFDGEMLILVRHNSGHTGFPKGHPEAEESDREAAIREVREETGLEIRLTPGFLETTEYELPDGTSKTVSWYLGRKKQGKETRQPEEINEVLRLTADQAMQEITYDNDRLLLEKALKFISQAEEL